MAPGALVGYYSILSGEARARYISCKDVRLDADLSSDTRTLWRAHDRALRERGGFGSVGLMDLKVELARRLHSDCAICERVCGAKRDRGETGHCGVLEARVSSEFLHMGEEPDLVPSYTIFFSGCTFDCVFCQNWDISTNPLSGEAIPPEKLASMIENRAGMGEGSRRGIGPFGHARNVNWVGGDPSSNLLYILQTMSLCEADLPQVWNSNMYLTQEAMRLLDGVIDVYLTDFKYGNDSCAERLSNAPSYMRVMTRNHVFARTKAEMIIRHLVLPGHTECCTRPVLSWIASNLTDVKVNVMGQYRPQHRAREFPELARGLRTSEYEEALRIAEGLCLDLVD